MARADFQVLVLPFFVENGRIEFCILHRSDMDIWQFVSGGGEDDETLAETAKREAFEETGISHTNPYYKLDTLCSIPSGIFGEYAKAWGETCFVVTEYAFAVQVSSKDIAISHEHTQFEWLSYDKAYEKLKYDSNRTALWELNRRIKLDLLGEKI